MAIIYHLIQQGDWSASEGSGQIMPESLAAEGFIHCSKDEAQALAVADRLYGGVKGMLVLEVDTDVLTSPVKWEPSRSGAVYPHIYGPLNTGAVVAVRALLSGAEGGFSLGDGE